MRKSSAIDALLPTVRQEVLAATLMHPNRWWYLSDLADHLKRSPSSLQREIIQLADAGILETRREANRTYYRASADCPLLPELTGLIAKTVGIADVLRRALSPFNKQTDWAFIYGSVARGDETSGSDIDLLVIGDVKLSELAQPLKAAERELARPISPTIYPHREFAAKLRSRNHFVRSLVSGEKLFLLGDSRGFARAFAIEATPSASNQPQRNRRVASGRRSRS